MAKLPEAPEGVTADQWIRAVAVAAAADCVARSEFVNTLENNAMRMTQTFEQYIKDGTF